jgi:2-polyprenyl-6-methoxyphenol hydroxylase-like FAD-dependent oxidoreductase
MKPEVVVVGAGPVGLMLAAELRAQGIAVLVLERLASPDTRLRAPAITERTIEALERHGLLDRLAGDAQRYRAAEGATSSTLPTDLRMDGVRALPVRQDLVEQVLEEHVRALGGVVRRGHELVGLTTLDDGVELRVRGAGAPEEVIRAAFVVGCDGGRSTVRSAAGIGFPGSPATITGYQAEVELADPDGLRRGWHRTPTGIAAYELCPSRIVSIEFTGPLADRSAPVTPEEVQASLRRTSATDVTLAGAHTLTRFTDNARLAETYRRGRVLLAGDAAHVHAPFGGQGLNLGVQDAVNLGWKLAATLRRWAPAGLLDSYERERRPVAEQVLRNVQAAITLMDPDARMTPVHELFGELRGLDVVRRHMHEKTAMIGLRYAVDAPGTEHPLLGRAPRGLRVGTAEGTVELSRVARPGFGLLLVLSDVGQQACAVAEPWRDRVDVVCAPAAPSPADVGDPTDAGELAALLLRPDGHTVWVGDNGGSDHPSALVDALECVFGSPAAARRNGHEQLLSEALR